MARVRPEAMMSDASGRKRYRETNAPIPAPNQLKYVLIERYGGNAVRAVSSIGEEECPSSSNSR
jgi:hypothetical protein